LETRLFQKFLFSIEDIHAKGGKFVTNKVENEEENDSDKQHDKLEKIISTVVRAAHQGGGGTFFGSQFASEEVMTCHENANKSMRYSIEAKAIFGATIERNTNQRSFLLSSQTIVFSPKNTAWRATLA
jgi:hypothetical protein